MADRVLFLSYAFPPIAAPEAHLAAKAVRGLADAGVEVDLVAAATRPWRRSDPSLLDYVSGAADVRRIAQPLWLPLLQPTRALRRYPDAMRFLRGPGRRLVAGLDLDRYDAMVSWSQWHSVHLLALDVRALRPDLRWLAHFSDPWVGNPLVALHGAADRMASSMEASVVEAADVLEFTTEETARHMLGRYPADLTAKARVVPHVFDERLYPDVVAGVGERLTMRYLGTFYGARSPKPLLDALATLAASEPGCLDGIDVELVGGADRGTTRHVDGLPTGMPRWSPPVDYLSSLGLMRSADLLVLVDAPATVNLYLASKLIDYIGASRPIVALTPPGRAADIVRALGGPVAAPDDPAAVVDAVRAGIELARAFPVGRAWGDPEVRAAFTPDVVARARLASLDGSV